MRHLIVSLYVLASGFSPCFAQKTLLSEAVDFNIRRDDFYILGPWNGQTAVYVRNNDAFNIVCYGAEGQVLKTWPLTAIQSPCDQVRLTICSNTIVITWEKIENKKKWVYGSQLRSDGSMSPVKELFSVAHTSFRKTELMYAVSPDKRHQVVFHANREDGITEIQAHVWDENLQVSRRITQKIALEDFELTDVLHISNLGNLYLLASETPNSRGNLEGVRLLANTAKESEFKSFEVPLNKHSIVQPGIYEDAVNTNIYICGYYGDGKFTSPKGLFFTVFDEEQQAATASHFTPIAMQVTGYKADLRDMKIKDVVIKKDGGPELITERTYQNTRTLVSNNPALSTSYMPLPETTRTVNEFYYDELAIFNLKADGTLVWNQVILKEQMTTEDSGIYSSYGFLNYPKGHVFLFNDFGSKRSRLMAAYLSAKGEHQIKEVQTREAIDEWDLLPRSAIQTAKSEIWIPALRKGSLCFFRMQF
ncbi:MAG: hypothetical protein JNM44_10040 [Chitinophagaceae bacterium]|nr:hypothetical protein [Chitinophagaceae bacterium]